MSTTPPVREPVGSGPPQLRRDPGRKSIAGVAAGLSEHTGIRLAWIRLAFVIATLLNGLGVLLYAVMWVLLPVGEREEAAGLESASRRGMRPGIRPSAIDPGMLLSVGFIVVGLLWVLTNGGVLLSARFFVPLVLSGIGVILLWLQADRATEQRAEKGASVWKRLGSASGAASIARLVGGLLLVGLGSSWLLASQIGLSELPQALAAALALLAALFVVAAPWLHRLRSRAREAEQRRIRAEARSDMAAHLHDSVLQTLALIQRRADDPAAVASLARRQERELRTWLYGNQSTETTLQGALASIRSEVEQVFPVAVEVVCVGDAELDDASRALVQAVGEAVTNAAKHSGSERIDVFAEAEPDTLAVFIRDRGVGFDIDAVDPDRMGVRESIQARMERHGGTVRIRSGPGEGTEVILEMNR